MDFKKELLELKENGSAKKEEVHVRRWLSTEVVELKAAIAKDENFFRRLEVESDNYDAVVAAMNVAIKDPFIANHLFVEVRSEISSSSFVRSKYTEATLPAKKEPNFFLSLLHAKEKPKMPRRQKRMREHFKTGYESLKSRVYNSGDTSCRNITFDTWAEAKEAEIEMKRLLAENPSMADVMLIESRNSAVGDNWIEQPATSFNFDVVGKCDDISYRFVFGYSTKRVKTD